jgi:hypothetical protein
MGVAAFGIMALLCAAAIPLTPGLMAKGL